MTKTPGWAKTRFEKQIIHNMKKKKRMDPVTPTPQIVNGCSLIQCSSCSVVIWNGCSLKWCYCCSLYDIMVDSLSSTV